MLFTSIILAAAINLIPNGDFSKGKVLPENWEKPDNLTSFYVSDPERGRILKLDSRPESKQVRAWHAELKKNPDAHPPEPVFAKKPYYSAVGGLEGVMIDSALIPVRKGMNYKLSVDVRGESAPFVWIKGFRKHPKRNMNIDSYQTRLHTGNLSKTKWKTFSIGFNPTQKAPATTMMKVRLYLYWPVGVCYFSNVRVEEITPDEMKELVKKRELINREKQ